MPSARSCARSTTRMSCTWEGRVSPAEDMETINTELILADLQTLDKACRAWRRKPAAQERAAVVEAAQQAQGHPGLGQDPVLRGADPEPLRELFLLTNKPLHLRHQLRRGGID